MRITVLCAGKCKERFYADAVSEYVKRLSRYAKAEVIEVEDEKTPDGASDRVNEQILEKEAARMMKHIPDGAYVIALAVGGKEYTSPEFADRINDLGISGKSHIIFVIGGSLGLAESIYKRANERIGFGKMTFPHQLFRVMLLEQIYRAYRIISGEPYHK
ncbi:MAG: Ribosomal RNA large subunit methyltransferase H [Firmicutes bacterium ADurb.Bin354]|nr:MAG: Ribosomal RNA large subunit methyltransferase H [Firmicutes bacterium ADurb.Bin354]